MYQFWAALTNGHQVGLDITMAEITDLAIARIRRRKILSGLIREYKRAA